MVVAAIAHDHNGDWMGEGARKDSWLDPLNAKMEAVYLGLRLVD